MFSPTRRQTFRFLKLRKHAYKASSTQETRKPHENALEAFQRRKCGYSCIDIWEKGAIEARSKISHKTPQKRPLRARETSRSLRGHYAVTTRYYAVTTRSLRSLRGHYAVTTRSLRSLRGHYGHYAVTTRTLRGQKELHVRG